MQLELVDEEDMVIKPKKEPHPRSTDIKVVPKPRDSKGVIPIVKDEEIGKIGGSSGGSGDVSKGDKAQESGFIIKRIYFPNNLYNAVNQEFNSIINKFGLSWLDSSQKDYFNKENKQLRTGIYSTKSGDKKLFAIYEGQEKPATFIVKIVGGGGNFLLELNSFCINIGCIIEDKDEAYTNNILKALSERGEVYVDKVTEKLTEEEIKKIEEEKISLQKSHEEKIQKLISDSVEKFIEDHRFYYDDHCEFLFWKRGLGVEFIRKFRKLEVEKDIRLAVESGQG